MTPRNHHFVSACYLKRFGVRKKPNKPHRVQVFDRDGRAFNASVRNVASKRDFNRIAAEGYAPDWLENQLSRVETKVDEVLDAICAEKFLIDQRHRQMLLEFMGLLAVRNPEKRERHRAFVEDVSYLMLDVATATEERWRPAAAGTMSN